MKNKNNHLKSDSKDSAIEIIGSKEYGASKLLLSIARTLELDRIISSRKIQWREDILAMAVGKLIFPLNECSLANAYADTILWECCGHPPNKKPDVDKNCHQPLVQLLSRQHSIQKKLSKMHLENGNAFLYDITSWDDPLIPLELHAGLLTNTEGCPIGMEFFPNIQDDFNGYIESIVDKYKIKSLLLVSNFQIESDTAPIGITHLTHSRVKDIVNKKKTSSLEHSKIEKKLINPIHIENIYQQLPLIEKTFRNDATDSSSRIPLSSASMLLRMLSFYLEWHMIKKLERHFQDEERTNARPWNFSLVIERLKSIRSQTIQIENIIIHNVKNALDKEQSEIISAFGISPEQLFS